MTCGTLLDDPYSILRKDGTTTYLQLAIPVIEEPRD